MADGGGGGWQTEGGHFCGGRGREGSRDVWEREKRHHLGEDDCTHPSQNYFSSLTKPPGLSSPFFSFCHTNHLLSTYPSYQEDLPKCVRTCTQHPRTQTDALHYSAPKKAQKMSLNEFLGDSSMYLSFAAYASNSWLAMQSPGLLGR